MDQLKRWKIVYHTTLYSIIHKMLTIQMSKRVTIMLDEDLDKKLRLRQAKLIQQERSSYSYSRVLNESLRKVLK